MTVTAFLIILTACAAATSLLTEGVKRLLNELGVTYASNVLVLILAMAVGCIATSMYYSRFDVPFTPLNSIYLVMMGVANWLGATLGYDKVRQTITQIGVMNKEEE